MVMINHDYLLSDPFYTVRLMAFCSVGRSSCFRNPSFLEGQNSPMVIGRRVAFQKKKKTAVICSA